MSAQQQSNASTVVVADEPASWKTENPNKQRDAISWDAYKNGLQTGAAVGSVAAVAVLSANKYWPAFRNRLSVSGKTALVVMSGLASFTLEAESRLVKGAHNPELYMQSMDPGFVAQKAKHSSLPLYQRAGNFLYDHPYRALASVGVPLVGGIYAYQHANRGISASQQIMHTRIYGQGAVVVLLLSSMAFHDYMQKRGRFEPEGQANE